MDSTFSISCFLKLGLVLAGALLLSARSHAAEWHFAFGSATRPDDVQVTPGTTYNEQRGFGFLQAPASDKAPSVFAVDVPEGNYDVTMRFGDPAAATSTTIKAEARRLMLHNITTTPGQFETRTFTVNVKKPAISTGGAVSIDSRESSPPVYANWDEHLSFEINGDRPGVASIEIVPSPNAITVFLAGDSTVTDQRREPWAGWGQMLPRFFRPGVAVSNHAWSGLALFSFERQRRLEKILSMTKPGDYLFIQFGHNDQKDKSANAGPFTSYKANLKRFVQAARGKGGIPVLLSPMERRRWNDGQAQTTLSDFAEAVRQVGAEEQVPVIDLHAMSLKLYSALGQEGSKQAFVHYPAGTFPDQAEILKDDTHHNGYGGYELARCVVEGIKAHVPELAKHLSDHVTPFDPSQPDSPEAVRIPLSPEVSASENPAGS